MLRSLSSRPSKPPERMRRNIFNVTAIGWLTSIASGAQPEVIENGDTALQGLRDLLSATPITLEPSTRNSSTDSVRAIGTTVPKIVEVHIPKGEVGPRISLSVVSQEPDPNQMFSFIDSKGETHHSERVLLIPRPTSVLDAGMQAMAMMELGTTTTPTITSAPGAGFTESPTPTPAIAKLTTLKEPLPVPSLEVHNPIGGDVISGVSRVQPGLQALGLNTDGPSSTSTSTPTSPKILMSGFMFSGTTYPPLRMETHFSLEVHVSQTALNLDSAVSVEQNLSPAALAVSTPQPSAQPAVTKPADVPQTSIPAQISQTTTPVEAPITTIAAEAFQTTTPLVAGAAANGILISAFTFQGTPYPAVPLVPENSTPAASAQSGSQAAAIGTTPNPESIQPQLQPSQAEAPGAQPLPKETPLAALPTSTAVPAQQGGAGVAEIPGFSVSGIALPTTWEDNSKPRPTTPSSASIPLAVAGGAAISTSLYISENPAGIPIVGATTMSTTPTIPLNPSSPSPQNPNPASTAALPFVGIPGSAGGAQSFITSGLPYTLTTDANGYASFRPLVTGTGGGGLWGNGTGPGRWGNSTGGIVPFLSAGVRVRGDGWRPWRMVMALVVGGVGLL